ncbi:MAG: glycosyltransferase family 9 protein [Candidatus Coatesbacteria bacterium]|nr:glycosyltransferase family 9 protein [Candidatus Coatesbacteria bacterium]
MGAKRFLVIKLGSIGDVVHALPAVSLLRKLYPDAVIDWLVEPKSASILDDFPHISSRIVIDTKQWRRAFLRHPLRVLSEIRQLIARLKRARYDASIDLQGLLKSSIWAWVSKSRLRFGFPSRECRERLSARLNNRKCWHTTDATHVVEKLCSMAWATAEELGDAEPARELRPCEDLKWDIAVKDVARQQFGEFLKTKAVRDGDLLVGINPCAGWATKRWSASNFARMIRTAQESDDGRRAHFMLLYGPGEEGYAEDVIRHLGDNVGDSVFLAPPSDIPLLCAMLDACDVVVSGDTAVLHIAAALGRPTVALFGPSDPARNGPFGNRSIIVQHRIACGPCYKRECKNMACIKNISPTRVAASAMQILQVESRKSKLESQKSKVRSRSSKVRSQKSKV